MSNEVLTLLILLCAMILYLTELIPAAVTAILSCAALSLFGVVPRQTAFSGFASEPLFVVSGMMVVGIAILETGLAGDLAARLVGLAGGDSVRALVYLIGAAMLFSSVINNATATATMLPIFFGVFAASPDQLHEKDWMIPLAVAANVGGFNTLLGSLTQLIMHNYIVDNGMKAPGVLDYALVGVPCCLIFALYAGTVGRRIMAGIKQRNPRHSDYYAAFMAEKNGVANRGQSDPRKKKTVLCIFLTAVSSMALVPSAPFAAISVIAAAACVVTGCVSLKTVYGKMDWASVIFVGSAISFASGLGKSGATQLITNTCIEFFGESAGPWSLFIFVVVLSGMLTQFMSNNASVAILVPIGHALAVSVGANPLPYMIGISFSLSCSFCTPIATATVAQVFAPGGYRFADYARWGLLLTIVLEAVVIVLVPVFWPL